jgi:hypothetical protein
MTGVDGAARPPVGGVCPLVFDVRPDGSGLSTTIVDAIATLVTTIRYGEVYGEADTDRLGFVRAIEAFDATSEEAGAIATSDLRPADGIDDTFLEVPAAARLVFRAHLHNVTIAPADYEQTFRLDLRVYGDGHELTTRRVRVIVPIGSSASDGGVTDGSVDGTVLDE